jgi:hypothetical protein
MTTHLDLFSKYNSDGGSLSIANALSSGVYPNLTSIDLGCINLGDKVAAIVFKALGSVSLTSINLDGNDLKRSAASIAHVLNPSLINLGLGVTKLENSGAIEIASMLTRSECRLTNINLASCLIRDDGVVAIAEALKVNTILTRINLGHNLTTNKGAISIAAALKINTTLTSIDLAWNNIGNEGADAIAEALKINKKLTSIALNGNFIRIDDMNRIGILLESNKRHRRWCDHVLSRMVIGISFVRANSTNDLKYLGLLQLVQNPIVQFISTDGEAQKESQSFVAKQSAFSRCAFFRACV